MTTHLNDEEISKWLAEDCTPEMQQHGRECTECQAKIASFRSALQNFRDSADFWANRQPIAAPRVFTHAQRRPLRWVAVTATAALLTAIPVYERTLEREREAKAAEEAQLDAELLKRVNAHLSRTAPESLQPLVELFTSNSASTKQGDHR